MATRKRERIFALFGAVLFLVTSSALVIALIVSGIQSRNQNKAATQSTSNTNTSSTKGTKLQGTKLAGFTPTTTPATALQSTDLRQGSGTAAKAGDTVVVDYTGALAATGVIFQSSLDSGQTFSFKLGQGQVIEGWDKGLIGAQAGTERRLVIPAAEAYGSQAQNGIPANSDLVFDITVHAVTAGN